MAINPEYKIPEITFENNAALCTLYYRYSNCQTHPTSPPLTGSFSQMTAVINNCTLVRP